MTTDDAGYLLAGPRGRRLLSLLVDEAGAERGADRWWDPLFELDDMSALPDALLRELAARLQRSVAQVDLAALRAAADPSRFMAALADSVTWARYWQHPDLQDVALAAPAVAEHLRPVARAVAQSPAAAWWSRPVDLSTQLHLQWLFDSTETNRSVPDTRLADAGLRRWQQDVAGDEELSRTAWFRDRSPGYASAWWSGPQVVDGILVTTPLLQLPTDRGQSGTAVPELPVGTTLIEDGLGVERMLARPVHVRADVRVYDIRDAADWVALVEAHPMVVTFSRRRVWWPASRWGGAWAIPDWAAVAREWDAVHLSVRGYLAVSGRLLATAVSGEPVGGVTAGPAHTLLAGWSPAVTYWLNDVIEEIGAPVPWGRVPHHDPGLWVPDPA